MASMGRHAWEIFMAKSTENRSIRVILLKHKAAVRFWRRRCSGNDIWLGIHVSCLRNYMQLTVILRGCLECRYVGLLDTRTFEQIFDTFCNGLSGRY